MKIEFNSSRPIYTQIVDEFKKAICSGTMAPGERVAPIRELAFELGINPNTLQRAMLELEREKLLFTERTSGRFVTTDGELIKKVRKELSAALAAGFCSAMSALGCSKEEMLDLISRNEGEQNGR